MMTVATRLSLICGAFAAGVVFGTIAFAQGIPLSTIPAVPDRGTKPPAAGPVQPALPQGERLFLRLKDAKTPEEARGVATLLVRRWSKSGSATADLISERMKKATQENNLNLAVELADRLIALEPDWADAWHQRAALFFRLNDPARAMYDLAEALKREPKHFVALSGLASLLQQQGKDKAALRAYREVLAIYPLMEGVKQAVDKLAPSVDGRDA
jgi:tetratricopeptide (TPR) repeat protein